MKFRFLSLRLATPTFDFSDYVRSAVFEVVAVGNRVFFLILSRILLYSCFDISFTRKIFQLYIRNLITSSVSVSLSSAIKHMPHNFIEKIGTLLYLEEIRALGATVDKRVLPDHYYNNNQFDIHCVIHVRPCSNFGNISIRI